MRIPGPGGARWAQGGPGGTRGPRGGQGARGVGEGEKEKRKRGKEEEGEKEERKRGKEEEGKKEKRRRGKEELKGTRRGKSRLPWGTRGSFFFFLILRRVSLFPQGKPFPPGGKNLSEVVWCHQTPNQEDREWWQGRLRCPPSKKSIFKKNEYIWGRLKDSKPSRRARSPRRA